MASSFSISTALLIIAVINTVFVTVTVKVTVTAIPEGEYHSMLAALRFRGYHLFANAISTTDLHFDIINGNNFTVFAPIDSALYALDMTLSAADYTTVLRFHCVPHRLSVADLRMLQYSSNSVPSLVPGHEIHVVNPLTSRSPIMIEGVDIAVPGVFYGTHIAVHGLEGIMDFRSLKDTVNSSTPTITDHTPITDPVTASSPRSPIDAAASPDVSLAHRISVSGAQRYPQPEMKSESESITQPREEHVSTATRSELLFHKIPDVSLAKRSIGHAVEEFDDDDDDDDEQLSIANVRQGDLYTRALYTSNNMICVQE